MTPRPLLLLHGFGGAARDFGHVFADGLGPEWRVHSPDLAFVSIRESAKDVRALLDREKLERVRAVGISGGANVLLHLAAEEPERVEAMVVVSPTIRFPDATRAVMREMAAKMGSPWRERALTMAESTDDLRADLAPVRARTLVVYGDRDPLYPVEIGVEIYRALTSSAGARLWVVPGGGHSPAFNPTFARVALDFLTESSTPKPGA
jgi:pimeloyl-ACP methyl ester carboxylesterase